MNFRIVGWHTAIAHDSEREHDDAFLPKLDRCWHDGKPIAFHRNINALEITLEIHPLRIREHLHAAVLCSAASSATRTSSAWKLTAATDRAGTGHATGSQGILNALAW